MTFTNHRLSTPFADELPPMPITMGRDFIPSARAAPAQTFEEKLQDIADFCLRDPANLSRFIGLVGREYVADTIAQRKKEVTAPMPPVATLTAGQSSIFDNWGSDKKPSRGQKGHYAPRYQATIEVWTTPAGTEIVSGINSAFAATAPLLTRDELASKIAELRKSKMQPWKARNENDAEGMAWERFGNLMLTVHDSDPTALFGPVFSRSGGTRYYLNHIVSMTGIGTPNAVLSIINLDDGRLDFTRFDTKTSNKKVLPAKVVAHSRISNRADMTAWRTADMQVAGF